MTAVDRRWCTNAPHLMRAVGDPETTECERVTLTDVDDLCGAAGWLFWLLAFDRLEEAWVLMAPATGHGEMVTRVTCDSLDGPDQAGRAQQWATDLIERRDAESFIGEITASGTALRVTEWRAITVQDRHGWVPLFNITRACLVGVNDLAPDTGQDCPCPRTADTTR